MVGTALADVAMSYSVYTPTKVILAYQPCKYWLMLAFAALIFCVLLGMQALAVFYLDKLLVSYILALF